MFKFPYIASIEHRYRADGAMYGTVCLDRFNEEIKKAFLSKDFIQMSMHLMNWAQYYSTNHSNPYNKTQWLHLGLPEGYTPHIFEEIRKPLELYTYNIREWSLKKTRSGQR